MVGVVASLVLATLATLPRPTVDLGYGIYRGYTNSTIDLNVFKGIRFAAPPIEALRWAKPETPETNRSAIFDAIEYSSQCPQSADSVVNGSLTHERNAGLYDEDCLFLNVWSPVNASNLPVLVWIHGGGYGQGNGRQDLSEIIVTNNNTFIGVSIQYRLGAFGFLSSDEIYRFGAVNAGLLDMMFALQWVQDHISQFGGDPERVTISGESAGGGAVMLLDMAYGGTLGNTLFNQSIASSPYLPMQYGYKDWIPSQAYYAFADMAGCPPSAAYGSGPTILNCLRDQDSDILIQASQNVSASGLYGTWGFLPVTDGEVVQGLPSQQLQQQKVNGFAMLSGNNANEGTLFVPFGITTEDILQDWLSATFPLFSNEDIAQVLITYPGLNASDSPTSPLYATNGLTGATAINQSSLATGHQQRAFNIYAETTFICPSYWLVEAFSGNARQSFKYQYSAPLALHGSDVSAYFGPAASTQGPDLAKAFATMWGNFVRTGNPSVTPGIANGVSTSNESAEAVAAWPPYHLEQPKMVNLNQTGGEEVAVAYTGSVNVTEYVGPGLENAFTVVDAYTWEGGRGYRCDFWRSMGLKVPE